MRPQEPEPEQEQEQEQEEEQDPEEEVKELAPAIHYMKAMELDFGDISYRAT